MVQTPDERVPRNGEPGTEVPYGTVIRVGPLLVAPLYGEQARSLREGRLALPVIGHGHDSTPSDEPLETVEAAVQTEVAGMRRPRWPLWLGLAVLLVAASVAATFALRPRLDPRRVLVVLEGWPDSAVEEPSRLVAQELFEAGFEAVPPPEGFVFSEGGESVPPRGRRRGGSGAEGLALSRRGARIAARLPEGSG